MGNMVLPFIDRDLLHKSAFNGGSIVYKQDSPLISYISI